jgi:rubrerythrin
MADFVNPFAGMIPERKMSKNELLRALRLSLSAEEEAVHLYTSIADACDSDLARAVLIDIANEERVHKGEFQRLIELLSPEEAEFMNQGAAEVDEITNSASISADTEPDENKPLIIGNLKQK